jgi:hypothetical protein
LAFDAAGNLYVAALIGQGAVKFTVEDGDVVASEPFGSITPYPSGVLVGADGNVLVSSLGNDNPADLFWPGILFPGNIARVNPFTQGAAPFLVGDVNRDAVVDGADLAIWQATYGTPYDPQANADLDGDFDTDGRDFLLWQRGFGNAGITVGFQPTALARYVPALGAVAVPEPNTLALLSLSLFGMSRPRKPNVMQNRE